MSTVNSYLSPEEIAAYQNRRDQQNTAFKRAMANLVYQRSNAETNYGVNQNRVNTGWNQNWNNQQGGFARRGVFNSGIYTGAGTNWQMNKDNALADMGRQYAQQQGGFEQLQGNLEAVQNSTIGQIEREQQANQAMKAARIQGV
jgi:hypothetical protein